MTKNRYFGDKLRDNLEKHFFFSKIGLRHFSTFIEGELPAKNQKNLMMGKMKTFVTDGLTVLVS